MLTTNRNYYLYLFAATVPLLLFFGSCRSTKKIQTAISKKDTIAVRITNQVEIDSMGVIKKTMDEVKKNHIDFKTFSAKIKVEYQDSKGKQPNITAYIRAIKDSIIWISGYATVFNIEAFRVLIRKDSVFVLDKINKEVQQRSIDYLQEVSEIPFDFNTLQDLLVGNPIFFTDSVVSFKESELKILLSTIGKHFKHLITINKDDKMLVHSKLDDVNIARNRTADITYGDFEHNNATNFATYREITVSEKNKLDIQLKFKQYDFNVEVLTPFTIPKNYKQK